MIQTLTLDLPRDLWWTASNERAQHHMTRARLVASVRSLAAGVARQTIRPVRGGVACVLVTVCTPIANRLDPANVGSTVVKAMLDGMVDAGVLPDDDSAHMPLTMYQRGPRTGVKGMYRLVFHIREGDGSDLLAQFMEEEA
jgi:crossover junction endodeoxyribonuclease RusA